MHTIIFKAQRESDGQWIYGSLIRRESVDLIGGYEITSPTTQDPLGDTIWIEERVTRESVCQFTTLKDKNGKYIFQGDMVSFYFKGEDVVCTVVWNEKLGMWSLQWPDGYINSFHLNNSRYTVVGSIHDIAKEGDTIQWTFGSDYSKDVAGKTFTAKVSSVNFEQRTYGVYVEYFGGQDLISFDAAKIIEKHK